MNIEAGLARAKRKGDWMLTSMGVQFWPLDPRPEEINYFDIACGLAHQCRYNGQCDRFYSTAEHSVLLARHFLAKEELLFAKWALLHDAAEAYLGDMIRPLKPFVPEFLAIEQRLERMIWDRYALHGALPATVKLADTRILGDEMSALFPMQALIDTGLSSRPRLGINIHCWSAEEASTQFCRLLKELF